MFSRKSSGLLTHKQSDGSQRKIALRTNSIQIGSGRKSTIRLKGTYVSDVHAVISRSKTGDWVVENQSPNGILVNGKSTETSVLRDGDQIQVGADDTFVVSGLSGAPKEKKSDGDDKVELADKKGGINPLYVVGGIVYAAVCLYFLSVFLDRGKVTSNATVSTFNLTTLEQTVVELSDYLGQKVGVELDPQYLNSVVKENTGHVPVVSGNPEVDLVTTEEKTDWVMNRALTVRAELRNAYWLSEQGQIDASIDVLKNITRLDSDLSNPATYYALGAMAKLQTKVVK